MHAPLHAPSDWSAVLHFVSLLIGIHDIYVFLLLSLLRDFDAAFAATLIAPALVIAMIQTHHDTKWKLVVAEKVTAQKILQWWYYGVNIFKMQNTDMKVCVWKSTRQENSMLCKQGERLCVEVYQAKE